MQCGLFLAGIDANPEIESGGTASPVEQVSLLHRTQATTFLLFPYLSHSKKLPQGSHDRPFFVPGPRIGYCELSKLFISSQVFYYEVGERLQASLLLTYYCWTWLPPSLLLQIR